MDQFEVVVSKAEALTPRIREFVLARANGAPMPGWAAGAHIDVHLPDVGRRSYSLIETASPRAAAEHPTAYRIAVLQESKSRGGSTFMHGLKTGDRLTISPPANNFPLGAGASEVALVAGGIGVTPLLAMACELSAAKRPFSFYYAGRSRSELAFLGEIERLASASATIHADDEAGRFFDLEGLMNAARARRAALPLRTAADDRGRDRAGQADELAAGAAAFRNLQRARREIRRRRFRGRTQEQRPRLSRFRPARPSSTCCSRPAKTRCMTASAAIAASARPLSSRASPIIATTS